MRSSEDPTQARDLLVGPRDLLVGSDQAKLFGARNLLGSAYSAQPRRRWSDSWVSSLSCRFSLDCCGVSGAVVTPQDSAGLNKALKDLDAGVARVKDLPLVL